MSLLPSSPDTDAGEDAGPRVVGVDSDDAEEVIAALSSETARAVLSALHDDPAPPSKLAEEVDTSLQNAQYHLENLEEAGAVEVVDTAYSEKGREMDVYAPADQPLVIFAGDDDESVLQTALSRLLGAVGVLAVASLAVQQWVGGDGSPTGGAASGSGPAAGGEPTATPTPESDVGAFGGRETPTPDAETTTAAVDAAREAAAGLPPGLVFFAGGLFALAVVAGVAYLR